MERLTLGQFNSLVGDRISEVAARVGRYWKQRGTLATMRFVWSRIFRHEVHVVYEATASARRSSAKMAPNEHVLQFGPENLDANLTSELKAFLGGDLALESLSGVRNGDRLFVVTDGTEFVHRGYILFQTRQSRLLGDDQCCPLIASCWTSPSARGRGLYRRALDVEVKYLLARGYQRVLIETDPQNQASRKGIEAADFTFTWEANVWILMNRLIIGRNRYSSGVRWRLGIV
jgi:hypothetical protein